MQKSPASFSAKSKKQTSLPSCALVATSLLLLCACEGIQSSLMPRGPQARVIADISWIMFFGAAAILLLVMCLALYAIYRDPGKRLNPSSNKLIIAGGVLLPVVTLSALLAYTVYAMGTLRAQPEASSATRIEVVGNRWWWDVHYLNADGSKISTANEIRIPAGEPVMVMLKTRDVIHSFWVPNLAGKIDLIPGRTNHITLLADAPGMFRGQCAEFCGEQHARMAFHVIAEPPQTFAAWLQQQGNQAVEASGTEIKQGRDAFIQHNCASCHTVRGVGVADKYGPDLTHFGSRRFLAAGTLENNRANLIEFIAHSQRLKPGNRMPDFSHLEAGTLDALAAYLESLE